MIIFAVIFDSCHDTLPTLQPPRTHTRQQQTLKRWQTSKTETFFTRSRCLQCELKVEKRLYFHRQHAIACSTNNWNWLGWTRALSEILCFTNVSYSSPSYYLKRRRPTRESVKANKLKKDMQLVYSVYSKVRLFASTIKLLAAVGSGTKVMMKMYLPLTNKLWLGLSTTLESRRYRQQQPFHHTDVLIFR